MLRALFERASPRPGARHSVGAVNGAMVARDPSRRSSTGCPAVAERRREPRGVRRPAAAHGSPAMSTGTHSTRRPLRRLQEESATLTFEDLPVPFRCARRASSGPPSTGSTAARSSTRWWPAPPCPACCRRPRSATSTSSTAASSTPSRSARRSRSGADKIFVLQVGRIERPLTAPRRPWEVARVAFEIARRHRFAREMAAVPDDVDAHVLPAGGASAATTRLGVPRLHRRRRRIRRPTRARGVPRRAIGRVTRSRRDAVPAVGRAGSTAPWRCSWCPAVDSRCRSGCSARRPLSPLVPGRWRPLRVLWVLVLLPGAGRVLLVVLFGLWLASGFGRKIRAPSFQRIHYARRASCGSSSARRGGCCTSRSTSPGRPRRVPRPAAARVLPARRPGRLVHADPRADELVRPRAAHRPQGHARLGPRDRRAAQPAAGPVHSPTRPPARTSRTQIGELATGLDENDAFVIFPEGGNFTPRRRERAIERLRKLGLDRMADAGRGDDQRAAPATRRVPRRARGGSRRRRRVRGAHRARPHADRRRRLARAADGQAAGDAVVAGAPDEIPAAATTRSSGCTTGGRASTTGSTRTAPRTSPLARAEAAAPPLTDDEGTASLFAA